VDENNNKYTLTIMKNQIHVVGDIWNNILNKFENKIIVYNIEGNDTPIPEKETKDEDIVITTKHYIEFEAIKNIDKFINAVRLVGVKLNK